MGNKSAKNTNRLLEEQRGRNNAAGDVFGDRSAAEYNWGSSARQDLWNRYNALSQGGGTIGGSAGTADWWDPASDFYKNMMETGGMTDADKANYRSWTTAPISGFYTGLKNQMARANNALGGYAGYNSQNAKLTRDAARQGFLTAQESESGLLDKLNENKFRGAAGYNSSFHKGSPGSAGVSSEDYYLNKMAGLMGDTKDLPYANLQLGGYGAGSANVNNRVDETPTWQKALMGAIPGVASAAVGAFTGGGGGSKKPQMDSFYWNNM